MAEQPVIRTLSEALLQEVKSLVRRERGINTVGKTRRTPQPGKNRGGGGGEYITFEITSIIRSFGLDCNAVLATVLNIGCSTTTVSIGDEVEVWDGLLCSFNLPPDLLIGLRGTATLMRNPGPYEEGVVPGPVADGACRWEVQRMCCAEELS